MSTKRIEEKKKRGRRVGLHNRPVYVSILASATDFSFDYGKEIQRLGGRVMFGVGFSPN